MGLQVLRVRFGIRRMPAQSLGRASGLGNSVGIELEGTLPGCSTGSLPAKNLSHLGRWDGKFPRPTFLEAGGTDFPVADFLTFFTNLKQISNLRKGLHTSQFCTAARQCLDTQGHIEHLPLPQRFQQLPTIHRHHASIWRPRF